MAEGSTVADPPDPVAAPNPAGILKSGDAVESETQPQPQRNPDPTPKPEANEEAGGGGEEKPSVASEPQTKKRKPATIDEFRNSPYFKIRSIIKDLRPLFIEVIHAPDFQESKAANEIRKRMKTMLELTKQLRNDVSLSEPEKSAEPPSPGASKEETHDEGQDNVPQPQNGEAPSSSDKGMGNASMLDCKIPEVKEIAKQSEEGIKGTYVIGGSPIGWNFLVFQGSDPVYGGETRESFRTRQTAHRSGLSV